MPIYNKFEIFDDLPNKVVSMLLTNNDDIFKLLKYDSTDALSRNITFDEKLALMPIPTGKGYSDETRIFLTHFTDDSLELEQSQLRVYTLLNQPETHVVGKNIIGFDVLSHNDILTLDSFKNRTLQISQQILNTLNGESIVDDDAGGALGVIRYVSGNNLKLRSFNRRFSGYTFTMTQFNT